MNNQSLFTVINNQAYLHVSTSSFITSLGHTTKPFKPITYLERDGDPDRKVKSIVTISKGGSICEHRTIFSIETFTLNHTFNPKQMVGFRIDYVSSKHNDTKYLAELLLLTFLTDLKKALKSRRMTSCLFLYSRCFIHTLSHPSSWKITD